MSKVYIGIDPSINSTGIVVQVYDEDGERVFENLYIVTSKVTKQEMLNALKYPYFKYVIYDKFDVKNYCESSDKELAKSNNLINIVSSILSVLLEYYNLNDSIYLVIEGISMNSNKTNSLVELSGLNFLIRNLILTQMQNIKMYIAPPAEVKKWVTGYGQASKDSIINAFSMLHKGFLLKKLDDIADAYFMSCYAKLLFGN